MGFQLSSFQFSFSNFSSLHFAVFIYFFPIFVFPTSRLDSDPVFELSGYCPEVYDQVNLGKTCGKICGFTGLLFSIHSWLSVFFFSRVYQFMHKLIRSPCRKFPFFLDRWIRVKASGLDRISSCFCFLFCLLFVLLKKWLQQLCVQRTTNDWCILFCVFFLVMQLQPLSLRFQLQIVESVLMDMVMSRSNSPEKA